MALFVSNLHQGWHSRRPQISYNFEGRAALISQKLHLSVRWIRCECLTLLTHILILVHRTVKFKQISFIALHMLPRKIVWVQNILQYCSTTAKQFLSKILWCYDAAVLDVSLSVSKTGMNCQTVKMIQKGLLCSKIMFVEL